MMTMKRLATTISAMALLVTLAISMSPRGTSATEDMEMEQMISSAKTAADHEALAAMYEKEAAEAEAKAAEHTKMAEAYKKQGGALIEKLHLDLHCIALAKSYERAGKEYAALAKAEREMAKAAK
jgi:hypothetical protein